MTTKEHICAFLGAFTGTYGDFLSHRDIEHMAGLEYPLLRDLADQADLVSAVSKYSIKRLNVFEGIKARLLTEKKMMLLSVHGEGYRIVKPEDQTFEAMQEGARELGRVFDKMATRVEHVAMERLTAAQQAERDLAAVKISGLRGLVNRRTLIQPKQIGKQ